MLANQNYCTICNDSKNSPCKKCVYDPYVMILHTDAKKLYKLTNAELYTALTNEYNFRAHSQTCSKYFLDEVEEAAIDKFKVLTDKKSITMLNKVRLMKEKRLDYLTKFKTIRFELENLINKVYDNNSFKFNDHIYETIAKCAESMDDVFTSTNSIFAKYDKEINEFYLGKARKVMVNKLLTEALGSDWHKLISREKQSFMYDVIQCKEDDIVNIINLEIGNVHKVKERTEMLNALLAEKFGKHWQKLIGMSEYNCLNNISYHTWDEVCECINTGSAGKKFQSFVNHAERVEIIENYIQTNIKKIHQSYIRNSRCVKLFLDDAIAFEHVAIEINQKIERRKRKQSINRFITKIVNKHDDSLYTDAMFTQVKQDDCVGEFIINGGKFTEVKPVINKLVRKLVRIDMLHRYVYSMQCMIFKNEIYQNPIVVDFLNIDDDEGLIVLGDDVECVVARYVKNIQLDNYIERYYSNKKQLIYDNQEIKNFLDSEVIANVKDFITADVKRIMEDIAGPITSINKYANNKFWNVTARKYCEIKQR